MSLIVSTRTPTNLTNSAYQKKNFTEFLMSGSTKASTYLVTPTQIAGLKLWIDASTLNGNDGDTISVWRDLSGSANDLTSATGTLALRKNVINGKNVARFTGSQRLATAAAVLNTKSTASAFLVFAPKSTLINILWEQGTSTFSFENASNLDGAMNINNTGGAKGPVVKVQNQFEYMTAMARGNQMTQWRNGISGTPVAYSGTTGAAIFSLGARSTNTLFTTADIAELIIYDNDIGDANRLSIQRYLATKYNL